MQAQQKNIIKTVLILLVVMISILLLFLNKITTARYLSEIELKINGLILLDKPQRIYEVGTGSSWTLVASTPAQKIILDDLEQSLRRSVKESTQIIEAPIQVQSQINKIIPDYAAFISILNRERELIGYFKPPFDQHKMLLTYSSVVTHR